MDPLNNGTGDARVMYHKLNSGEIKRNINAPEITGANRYGSLLRSANNQCFIDNQVGILDNNCMSTSVSDLIENNQNVTQTIGFTSVNSLNNYLEAEMLEVLQASSVDGTRVYTNGSDWQMASNSFQSGSYFITVESGIVIFLAL